MTHTILGAGGFAGNALAHELIRQKTDVRLVSRRGCHIDGTVSVKGDLMSAKETEEAVRGSDVVYLCVGLPYRAKAWKKMWPRVMRNTIEACAMAHAKLIFYDNVYMYGNVQGRMTEQTPYNPCSVKGEIRAAVATMLQDEMKRGTLEALIARSADVYGPFAGGSSVPHLLVFDRLLKGKKAQWLVDERKPHTFAYTLDCAKGMWLLANQKDVFNQVWHLPVATPAIDGRAFIEIAAKELGVPPEYSVLRKSAVRLGGLFVAALRETYEMLYQSEGEYHVDSSKFEKHFAYTPTSYVEGIRETLQVLRSN